MLIMKYAIPILISFALLLFLPQSFAQEAGCPLNDQLPSLEDAQNYILARVGPDDYIFRIYDSSEGSYRWTPDDFMNSSGGPEKAALCFVKHYKTIFRLNDPDNELRLSTRNDNAIRKDEFGNTHVLLQRIQGGVELVNGELAFHFSKNGSVNYFNGGYRSSFEASTIPTITEQQAISIAQQDYGMPASSTSAKLVFFTYNNTDKLSWQVLYLTHGLSPTYIIDAQNGNILSKNNNIISAGTTGGGSGFNPYLLVAGGVIVIIIACLVYLKRK